MNRSPALILGVAALAAGCTATTGDRPRAEKGPDGTVAYPVRIEASDPGARVEVNNDVVGKTPVTITIYGDKDGTFHNFGTADFVIRVFPVKDGQFIQTKTFRTGGWFAQEDRVPKSLYFDLNQRSDTFSLEPAKPRY